ISRKDSLFVAGRATAWRKIRLVASMPIGMSPDSFGSPVLPVPSVPTTTTDLFPLPERSNRILPSEAVPLFIAVRSTPRVLSVKPALKLFAIKTGSIVRSVRLGGCCPRKRMRMSGAICWMSAERARPSIASPRRGRAAENRITADAPGEVLHSRREVAVDLLKPHFFELRFEALGLLLVPLRGRGGPEPVEDQDVFRDQPRDLFARHAAGSVVGEPIGRLLFLEARAVDGFEQHVAPDGHPHTLAGEVVV